MRILILLFMLGFSSNALAHAGHDDAPGGESGSPSGGIITLSDGVIKNLGIETAKANLYPLGKELVLNATIEYLPERYANITPRANGSISRILVKLGDSVRKGQKLLTFKPVFVGSSEVTLTSPISGFVVKQNAVIGQSITPETAIMEIADTDKLLVRGITFSPSDFEQIKVGQKVKISTGKENTIPLTGVIQRLDVGSSKETRSFDVYALVDNPNRTLFPNSSVTLSVQTSETSEVLTVPSKAILGELGDYFLFVREGNNFERRSVVMGQKSGDMVEILEGVLPDEDVVTVGNYQLQYAKPKATEAKKAADDGHDHAH